MYKNVIWATDGSEAADRALAHAKALVTDSGGQLTVVYCVEYTLPGKGGGSFPLHANEDDVEAKIDRQVTELAGNGTGATLQKNPQPSRERRFTRSPNSRLKITPM